MNLSADVSSACASVSPVILMPQAISPFCGLASLITSTGASGKGNRVNFRLPSALASTSNTFATFSVASSASPISIFSVPSFAGSSLPFTSTSRGSTFLRAALTFCFRPEGPFAIGPRYFSAASSSPTLSTHFVSTLRSTRISPSTRCSSRLPSI